MALLDISNLSIAFPGAVEKPVVDGLSFSIEKGTCCAVVGESGSGKSLSALSILQLLPLDARIHAKSSIVFQGHNLLDYTESQMQHVRGRKISMIFQDAMTAFNPVLTVGYQLAEVLRRHKLVKSAQRRRRILEMLSHVGIKECERVYRAYPHQLSGGMRQRAMIAMALLAEPDLLIADEPTTALDVTLQAQILALLKSLQKAHQLSMLFISHDLGIVKQLADQVVVLNQGRCEEIQEASVFYESPQSNYAKKLLSSMLPMQSAQQSVVTSDVLRVHELSKAFTQKSGIPPFRKIHTVNAVNQVSLRIKRGETLALVGESGSGKTTVAKLLVKLYNPDSGRVEYSTDANALGQISLPALRKSVGFVFQDPYSALNPKQLVMDSLCEGLLSQSLCKNRKECTDRVDQVLKKVHLSLDIKNRYPHQFSGGERQRLCIARALVLSPKLLILDEPTSALDVSIQRDVLDLLKEIQVNEGVSYLLITHNLSVVAYMAHEVAVMQQGKLVETGFTHSVLTEPAHSYTQALLAAVPML